MEAQGNSRNLRQRAISLLYLVFIALVFIYVPSDFLDSMNEATRSIETSTRELNNLKEQKFDMFENMNKSIGIGQLMDSANYYNISKASDSAINHIEGVKQMLLEETGGLNEYGYPSKSKEFDVTDHLMLNTAVAENLKDILIRYKNEMKQYTGAEQLSVLDSILVVKNEITSSKGHSVEWGKFYFKKAPLSVTLMMLSKFQNEVRLVEYLILDRYERKFLKDFFVNSKSDKTKSGSDSSKSLRLLASQDIVQPGDVIKFFPQSNRPISEMINEMVFVANTPTGVRPVSVNSDGYVEYVPKETGEITLTAQYGEERAEVTVQVVSQRTDIRTKDLEILYAGIENPLKINLAAHSDENIRVIPNMGAISKHQDFYYAKIPNPGILQLKIQAKIEGDWVQVATKEFNVKVLPTPYALLASKNGGTISSRAMRVQNRLRVKSDFFDDESFYEIRSFKMTRIPSNGVVAVNGVEARGSAFSSNMQREAALAHQGDLYVFSDIVARGRDNREKQVPAMVFKIE